MTGKRKHFTCKKEKQVSVMLCVMFYFSNYWKSYDDKEIEGWVGERAHVVVVQWE